MPRLFYLSVNDKSVYVLEPARIVEPTESISVTAGDSATLECTISGSPELKVKWFKDGKEMISGRKYKITLKNNVASMKILAAEKGDTSEYRMELSNKVGKDQCTCSVTVLGQPLLVFCIHSFIQLFYHKCANYMIIVVSEVL